MKAILKSLLIMSEAAALPVTMTYVIFLAYCKKDAPAQMERRIDHMRSRYLHSGAKSAFGTVAEREAFRS